MQINNGRVLEGDNYKDILAFLDWMISELEKQLKN
jgi:hypothetical protein